MINFVNGFISQENVKIINDYIKTISFHTKENHVPLHNELFEKQAIPFDIHTRGEMPNHILEIFSEYSKKYYEAVQAIEEDLYHPPMFSKHYIARYPIGSSIGPQFDPSKPPGTYKSFIYWNKDFTGGELRFPNLNQSFAPDPGDLIFFVENEANKYQISKIESGNLFLSEAWMGKVGKAWMPGVVYEETDWDNWEIKGF